MKEYGTFTFSSDAIGFSELENYFVGYEDRWDGSVHLSK